MGTAHIPISIRTKAVAGQSPTNQRMFPAANPESPMLKARMVGMPRSHFFRRVMI
jgi:hypothetical protein